MVQLVENVVDSNKRVLSEDVIKLNSSSTTAQRTYSPADRTAPTGGAVLTDPSENPRAVAGGRLLGLVAVSLITLPIAV